MARFVRLFVIFGFVASMGFLAGCGNDAGTPDAGARCGDGIVQAPEQCDDGNQTPGDGCEADCTTTPSMMPSGPKITMCPRASDPPLASGTCQVTAGGAARLITGTVLTPGEVFRGGQVLVDASGRIACVGCDCNAMGAGATTVDCPTGVISPGLINPHDHLTYDQNAPPVDTGERYEARNDWRKGHNGHTPIDVANNATADQVRWAELRGVFAGTTSVVGDGGEAGLLRNLEKAPLLEGLTTGPVDTDVFPLGNTSGAPITTGCSYQSFPTLSTVQGDLAYNAHVAEGINDEAHNEFLCLSGAMGGVTVTMPQTSFVHAMPIGAQDGQKMATTGTALVWSPRSNIRLYGDTAPVALAARAGVQIALGTDWTASGSVNLLRELACADSWNQSYLGKLFTDEQLWLMVTRNAAAALGHGDALGVLRPGLQGDIAIFDGAQRQDHRAVIEAGPDDVVLVMRGGKPMYGDAAVLGGLIDASACDPVDVCGRMKSLCLSAEIGETYPALRAAVGNIYDAFFCGTPTNEPTCTPKRTAAVNGSTLYDGTVTPDDMDGDGIPNVMDNCPTVFNPIRPVDNGKQADGDVDGVGDVCDPCPNDPGTTGCALVNPDDVDGDGVNDLVDNCPTVANPDQADGDMDGHGNLCDACPMAPNPGVHGCPVSIYDIKSGAVMPGAVVAVSNVLVTGVKPGTGGGFFVQVKPGDPGYTAPENSGLFVFKTAAMPAVAVGNRVTIDPATVVDFHGERELTNVTVTVTNTAVEMPPDPVVVLPSEVTTGGARATALEGVVVQVANVIVADTAPAPAGGDKTPTNEYAVDAGLRIDDFLYLTSPFPTAGTKYTTISGVLAFRNANSKIEPRDATDLVLGPPQLVSLGPDAFTRVGYTNQATIPASAPMQVVLTRPVAADTVVTLSVDAADQGTLTVPASVTVPANSATANVLVTGVARSTTPVTVTATLDGVMKQGHVRVLDDGTLDVPSLVAITPAMAAVTMAGGSVQLNVQLDLPAPAAGVSVALSTMNGWTVPASATVLKDAVLGPFSVTQAGANTTDTVTATLGAVTKTATVNVVSRPVINEVDYDQAGTDYAEFVEIYNPGASTIDLTNLAVVFATNTQNEYLRVPLSGTLDPGKYLVIGAPASATAMTPGVVVPAGVTKIDFPSASNNIANSSPTGIAIIDTVALTVIDAVSLNGATTGMTSVTAQLVGFSGKTSFLEGTWKKVSDTTTGSCVRLPNGQDTDNLSADWSVAAAPTPGAPNM